MDEKDQSSETNSKILFIKNINFNTTDESFLNHFKKEGKSLVSAKMVRKNNLSQGYGFVEFKD